MVGHLRANRRISDERERSPEARAVHRGLPCGHLVIEHGGLRRECPPGAGASRHRFRSLPPGAIPVQEMGSEEMGEQCSAVLARWSRMSAAICCG